MKKRIKYYDVMYLLFAFYLSVAGDLFLDLHFAFGYA